LPRWLDVAERASEGRGVRKEHQGTICRGIVAGRLLVLLRHGKGRERRPLLARERTSLRWSE
jgi:hypothetical protein